MGHSPRGGKGLPIFYGGNYPLTSRVITHTRSFDSPKRGAGAGAGGHLLRGSGSSGGMRLLRLLVLLGMGLLVLSLAYLQVRVCGEGLEEQHQQLSQVRGVCWSRHRVAGQR